ncbi:hypothetical protein D3C86_1393680 [compost metagenome]
MRRFQRLGFQGRAHQAVHPGFFRQGGQAQHLLLGLDVQADARQVFTLHAGQHGHADQQRLGTGALIQHFTARGHHAQAAGAMHVDHPHAHFRSRLDGHRGGVRDVVELEVQEHFETLVAQGADDFRSAAGEEFFTDFDPAQLRVQLIGQLQCGVTGREIQGDDDRSLAGGHEWALRQVEIGAHCSGTSAAAGPDDR